MGREAVHRRPVGRERSFLSREGLFEGNGALVRIRAGGAQGGRWALSANWGKLKLPFLVTLSLGEPLPRLRRAREFFRESQ